MKIKVNRNKLLVAVELCAKLVINPCPALMATPNLRLSASVKRHTTELLASNGEETVVASVIDSHPESDCDTLINCAALTTLLKSVDSGYVTLDIHERQLDIYANDSPAGTLTATNAAEGPVAPSVPKNADVFILPSNFTKLLKTAFKYVAPTSENYPAITGVNLSNYGVTATNGHVLYNVSLPMQMKDSLTLPKPVLPTSMGNMPLTMRTWGKYEYEIRGINFSLYGHGLDYTYPDWTKFIKENSAYTGRFTLSGDLSKLVKFLKSLPPHSDILVTGNQKSLQIKSWEGEMEVPANTSCMYGSVLHIRTGDMLDSIEMGHREFRFDDTGKFPFKATGGMGFFIFKAMKDETVTGRQTNTSNASTDVTINNKKDSTAAKATDGATVADNQNKTPQEKEKENMENRTMTMQTTAITRFNTTPQIQPQSQAQPKSALDELEQLYNGLKETQTLYNNQIAAFGRKIKEAALAYRQRVRECNKANGRLKSVRKIV